MFFGSNWKLCMLLLCLQTYNININILLLGTCFFPYRRDLNIDLQLFTINYTTINYLFSSVLRIECGFMTSNLSNWCYLLIHQKLINIGIPNNNVTSIDRLNFFDRWHRPKISSDFGSRIKTILITITKINQQVD